MTFCNYSKSAGRSRFRLLSLLVLVLLAGTSSVSFSDSTHDPRQLIRPADSFVLDGKLSSQEKLPLVVFISQQGCEFCEALRNEVLFPMIRSGVLGELAIFREVSLDDGFSVTDFDASNIAGKQFAGRYGASVTPTILFLGPDGIETAEKMVGISNMEYYRFYLESSISRAAEAL